MTVLATVSIYVLVWIIWFCSAGLNNLYPPTMIYDYRASRYRKRSPEEIQTSKQHGARACLYSFIWPLVGVWALFRLVWSILKYSYSWVRNLFVLADFGNKVKK